MKIKVYKAAFFYNGIIHGETTFNAFNVAEAKKIAQLHKKNIPELAKIGRVKTIVELISIDGKPIKLPEISEDDGFLIRLNALRKSCEVLAKAGLLGNFKSQPTFETTDIVQDYIRNDSQNNSSNGFSLKIVLVYLYIVMMIVSILIFFLI